IILARHGQTRANAKRMLQGGLIDCDLDERGKQQAMMLAEGMRDYHIDWIITSNLIRSIHTAQTVAQYHPGVPFTKDARLNEVSWGELDGTSIKACQHVRTTVIGEWIEGNFDAKFPSGESAGECSARVKSAFRDILEAAVERNHTNLFLCLHGRITRVILASLIDKDLREMEKYKHTN
ncbi:histidine phosphatase superfamily, partial [Coemansia spiralis]